MKKHNVFILKLALIISLLVGIYTFIARVDQKQRTTELFKYNLSQVEYCFAQDYNNMDDDNKTFFYLKASSNLSSALAILDFTSYAKIKNHNELSSALEELYFCITENNQFNSRWKAVTQKREAINKYLHYVNQNPNDKNNSNALSRLVNNLRSNLEDVLLNYEGSSPSWNVAYKIDGNESLHDTYYTFKYTGDDSNSVKDVKYSIDSSNEGEDDSFKLENTLVHTGKLKLTAGLPKPTDRNITVEFEWNEKKESIILKKSK